MTAAELLAASERERDLYGDLLAVYRGLHAALTDGRESVDPAWLAGEHTRSEAIAAELRALAGALGPHRLTGAAVSRAVREVWRASATVAADAATTNRDVAALARARQAALAVRLGGMPDVRRGLAGYRLPRADRARIADRSA
jgi:hypothetical protein